MVLLILINRWCLAVCETSHFSRFVVEQSVGEDFLMNYMIIQIYHNVSLMSVVLGFYFFVGYDNVVLTHYSNC